MVSAHQTISTNLSLIIASLNEGEELHETLRSIFAGSVLPDEIIVVDDGGTDGGCSALERDEWRSRCVRVHRIERLGIAAARNTGSRLATGARLVFLDAHCRLDPHCLAAMQAALDARPDAIIRALYELARLRLEIHRFAFRVSRFAESSCAKRETMKQ